MSGLQNLKKQLIPIIKGMPIIVAVFIAAIYLGNKIIAYSEPMYQSMAKIKLDDQKYGFSNNQLYKDFDVFSTENKIESEAEILASPLLIEKTLSKLDFNTEIKRKGKIKNTLLYKNNSPFEVTYKENNDNIQNTEIKINIYDDKILLSYNGNKIETFWNEKIDIEGNILTLEKINENISAGIKLKGEYLVKFYSTNKLVNMVSENLDVKAIDKEIAVLRVVYKCGNPLMTAKFVNEHCKTYIDDYVETKTMAAKTTAKFINDKLDEVREFLTESEKELEKFKGEFKVVNTTQQTETGLREISKLKLMLINLEMNEKAIQDLEDYISNGDYFDEKAINFGFGDLLLTELAKKLKLWNDEKIDLLTKYTPQDSKVKAVEEKIDEIKNYVKEAVKNNRKDIETKREEINASLEILNKQFDNLPELERKIEILKRNYRLHESIYNFLSQKQIEANIAGTASIAFHRVIMKATVPEKPISPNVTLIKFVSGLLGLIAGIAIVYLIKLSRAAVISISDLERHTTVPVISVIRKKRLFQDVPTLVNKLWVKNILGSKGIISVNSAVKKEGKTVVAKQIESYLRRLNYDTILINFLPGCSNTPADVKSTININKSSNTIETKFYLTPDDVKKLKESYDFIILDSPATSIELTGIKNMLISDVNLFLSKSNYTKNTYLNNPDHLVEEFDVRNIFLVLNSVHRSTNYDGKYIGSRFHYNTHKNKFVGRIINLYRAYIKN